jgi:ATP-dependent helicase HrpA
MSTGEFGKGDYLDSLIQDLRQMKSLEVKRSDFRLEALAPHHAMNFRLLDEHGRQLELERNLPRLKAEFGESARVAFQAVTLAPLKGAHSSLVSGRYTQWDFGELAETLEIQKAGKTLFGYPALVDSGDACEIEVFDDLLEARKCHWQGLRRLFALSQRDTLKALQKQLPNAREIGLLFMQIGTVDGIIEQILNLSLERAFMAEPLPINREQFLARVQAGKPRLTLIAQEIARHLLTALEAHADLQKKLAQAKALSTNAHVDISGQIQGLIFPHCIADTPYAQLVHLPRYLKAIALRIDKLRANPSRDAQAQREWEALARPYQKLLQGQKGSATYALDEDSRLQDFRWQLEELRVALFAQELKTPMPMSAKRLEKVLLSLYR